MKILVTGGCGFIGSHVVDAYIQEGHDVVVIDNLSSGKRENLNDRARLYETDICGGEIGEIVAKESPDIVNHHAAQISVPLSVEIPLFDAEVNIRGTINLLEAASKGTVKRFIFSSTGGAIYGEAEVVPTPEGYIPEPASPYAISKLSAEKYIRYYERQFGLQSTVLRYSNVYGPRQIPHGEAGVVAIFTEKILAGEIPTVYHFPEEPLGMIRDYCYVKDIARASILATYGNYNGIVNIGTGKGTATFELYGKVLAVVRSKGKYVPPEFDNPPRGMARAGDIRVSTLNASKALDVLGWKAGYEVVEGLEETIDWYMGHEA